MPAYASQTPVLWPTCLLAADEPGERRTAIFIQTYALTNSEKAYGSKRLRFKLITDEKNYFERFWRTIKREYVYLNPEPTVGALRRGIAKYIDYYNNRRCHQGLAHQTPSVVYANVAA